MIDALKLMERAAQVRRLAHSVSDEVSAERLHSLADELEKEALDNTAYNNAPHR